MKNYRLIIEYDGTNYSGWQIQPNVDTIQQHIEDAIQILTKEKINLIASGRTDAGVHALGQVANFKVTEELNINKFQHSLNSILPADIAIKIISEADENFHARFDAKKRSYLYVINSQKSPFYKNFTYFYPPVTKLTTDFLNEISREFLGEFDFTSFSKKNSETKNKICNITLAKWKKNKDLYFFRIDGNRFLHGMVRAIVGTILEIAEKGYPIETVKQTISRKDRNEAGRGVPACGLYLYKVRY